jgi:hypothetical protein
MAWLENNLLGKLRIPWKGQARTSVRKYGKYYRPGLIHSCPFTGFHADDVYIEALREAVRSGDTLKEAFEGLANECARLLEEEAEYQASEESFVVCSQSNETQFTEDGKVYR